MTTSLVLGGGRSGKSRYAQDAAEAAALSKGVIPILIATATAGDAEMAARIAQHQADRGGRWRTLEAPMALAEALAELGAEDVAVVDCLTLWLSNSMAQPDADADAGAHAARMEALVLAISVCKARLWLVSNEVGWGIVPDNALARRFRDDAGRLHQKIAQVADEAVLIVAGLPIVLKSAHP